MFGYFISLINVDLNDYHAEPDICVRDIKTSNGAQELLQKELSNLESRPGIVVVESSTFSHE